MKRIFDLLLLPKEISTFEREYVAMWNRRTLMFFASHLVVFPLIAWANGTGPFFALIATGVMIAGPALAVRALDNPRHTSIIMGVASMGMGALLVHFGHGPVQIEMHFYFFVLIALLAVFANPMVIVAAATTVALHHAFFWFVLPTSVFNYEAPFWVVGVHALFVVIESVAACVIARSYYDSVVGLEHTVQARTRELDRRNADVHLMLDNSGQGFLTVALDGTVGPERAAIVETWLGHIAPGESFADVLSRLSPDAGATFGFGWEMITQDILPVEVALAQLPSHVERDGISWSISYRPVEIDGHLDRTLVILSDVTAQLQSARLEAEQGEFAVALERLSKDPNGFLEFWTESERLLGEVEAGDGDYPTVKRVLHTLKGNSAMFGLATISAVCHTIEDQMAESGALPTASQTRTLSEAWGRLKARMNSVVGDPRRRGLYVEDAEFEGILRDLVTGAERESVATRIRAWRMEPAQGRLDRMAEQTRFTATRLGKGDIRVTVSASAVRLEPEFWAPLWSSMVHVLRNAVDHGIESREERELSGKDGAGEVRLTVATTPEGRLSIEVADDGRGVDWARVAERASERGLKVDTHADAVRALCADGITTRDEVTETSGRGVGMGAVARTAESLGGHLDVDSVAGCGTRVRVVFPATASWVNLELAAA